MAQGLQYVDLGSKEDFKQTAKCNLVSRREESELFDRAFETFWQQRGHFVEIAGTTAEVGELASNVPIELNSGKARRISQTEGTSTSVDESLNEAALEDLVTPTLSPDYSPREALRTKDFALFSAEELGDAKRFLAAMKWSMARRRARRMTSSKQGRALDVRSLIRRNLRYGGELLQLAHRAPKLQPRQVVVLCDISGSMDRYSRLLLQLLHSLGSRGERFEVFLFGTRLTRVSHAFRTRDADAAIASASATVKDWAGGTRIGESLREFNRSWARRVLGNGAIVLIISDGWDRGNPALLSAEMERLQRASFRLIWLNPLLGSAEYRPITQGIRAILPHLDDFLPVHNLSSLENLAVILSDLPPRRPQRRQGKSHNNSKFALQDS